VSEGVHRVPIRRAGKPTRWYIYAWRGGPQIRVAVQPDRPGLTRGDIEAIAKALSDRNAQDQRGEDTGHGLSKAWQNSREWKAYAPSTRQLWGDCAAKIEAKWGNVPLKVLGDPRMTPKIVKWRDEMAEKMDCVRLTSMSKSCR